MKLTWVNVDLPDEPRWGDRWSEQEDDQGHPLYKIRARYRNNPAVWLVSRGDGSSITPEGGCHSLAYAKSVAQDDSDNKEEQP